jgi:hypothetical protein
MFVPSRAGDPIADGGGLDQCARPSSGQRFQWRALLSRIRARLPVYVADFRDDPKWLLMFIAARFVWVRRLMAFPARDRPTAAARSRIFPEMDVDRVAEKLDRHGVYRGLHLPAEIVDRMVAFADRTPCFGNFDRDLSFRHHEHHQAQIDAGRPILVGHYLDRLTACPEAAAIQADPVLRSIARRYLRADPVVISCRMWWSFPASGYGEADLKRASQDRFHFDLNDWRSLKFFFYLTEVDSESGAHVYVRGSHRKRRLSHQFSPFVGKSHADIIGFYGENRLMQICGRAGFGFAEDPFGFHMGTVATKRPRLMFEVEYGVSPPTPRRYYGQQDLRRRPDAS